VELRPPVPEGEPPAKLRKFQLSSTQQGAFCAAFLVLVFATSYVWPPYCDSGGSGHYMRNLYNNIYRYFAKTPFPTTVCMTQASPLTREDLLIWFLLHYHQVPLIETSGQAVTIDEAWKDVQKDDMVIAQDTGTKGTTPWLKSEKFQDQIVSRLVHSPDYKMDWSYGDGDGKNVYVFRRVAGSATTSL
jgi:hypothetical protein